MRISQFINWQLTEYGVCFSFSASITNPDYKRAVALVRSVPQNRLLIETDAPDMVPYSLKDSGLVNEPANLRCVAEKIAEIREMSVEMVSTITANNAQRIYG